MAMCDVARKIFWGRGENYEWCNIIIVNGVDVLKHVYLRNVTGGGGQVSATF